MARRRWKPYVPVAVRRERAAREMKTLQKKGQDIQPIQVDGRAIAKTFWGESWCNHIESFSDYANRLPRGRTLVRNGSVCHLMITPGNIEAIVSGGALYDISITIKPLAKKTWASIKTACAGQIGSLLDLLSGQLSDGVMAQVCHPHQGLFPKSEDIQLSCSCPDWAVMCKHVASALYGIGARLDDMPEQLFKLRGVNHEELIDVSEAIADATQSTKGKGRRIATGALSDVFGIDLSEQTDVKPPKTKAKAKTKSKKSAQTTKPKKPPQQKNQPKQAAKKKAKPT